MKIRQRFNRIKSAIDLDRWMAENGHDDRESMHYLRMDLEHAKFHGKREIDPTDLGLWMIIKWWNLKWYCRAVAYIIADWYWEEMEEDSHW